MFKFFKRVLRSYDCTDKYISFGAVFIVGLMFIKMLLFPYGMFGFGESNIFTEALISKTGFQNINPLFVDYNEADREVSRLVFSGLMKYDPFKRTIVNDLAFLSMNDEKTEYVLTLRDGLKWHDGKDLSADDVFFTYHDLIMNVSFPNQILKANFSGVSIEQLDKKTVKFKLEKPNIFFICNLVIGILPKHILGDVEPSSLLLHEFSKKPIGSGPYFVKEPFEVFPDGRMQVTLNRNPYYYAEPSEIEILRLISYPAIELILEDLNSLNAIVKVTGDYLGNFSNNARFDLFSYELPQYIAVFMNMQSEILKEKNVRVALQKCIDKEGLLAQFSDKKPVDTPLMELDQEQWEYQGNLTEAQGALKDAGYLYAADDVNKTGVRFDEDKNPLELKLIVRLYSQGSQQFDDTQKVVAFLQKAWEEAGFRISVEFLYLDEFEESIMRRDYDLLLVGQSLGYNLDTYSYWHSTQANPNGQNFSNYKSFAVDSLIEHIRSLYDQEKRQEKLTDLANQIREDFPAIFLYRPVYYYVSDRKLKGISMDGVVFPSDRFSNIHFWKFVK